MQEEIIPVLKNVKAVWERAEPGQFGTGLDNNIENKKMKTLNPRLGLKNLTDGGIDTFSLEKIDKLTGNPNYPAVFAEFDEMKTVLKEYVSALAKAADGTRVERFLKKIKKEELKNALRKLAAACAAIADGNALIFLSSGFELKHSGSSIDLFDAPRGIHASRGRDEDYIALKWEPLKNCRSYMIQVNEDVEKDGGWINLGVSTKSKYSSNGFVPGKRYWFRAAGVNSKGIGRWSQPCTKIAG